MKTKKIIILIAIFLAIGIGGCKKDYPIPEPPQPPQLSISASEITLIVGLSGEIEIKNVTQLIIESSNTTIASLRYDELAKKLIILSKAPGDVTFNISNKGNTPVTLKVTVKAVVLGLLDGQGEVVLEANYRYQTPTTLHLAPSGAARREEFLKLPHKGSWKIGEAVAIAYKKAADAAPKNLQTSVVAQSATLVYLKTTSDGKYIIFPKIKDGE